MKTSDHLWQVPSVEAWQRLEAHDWDNPSREAAYAIVRELAAPGLAFAEVGIGDCYDFAHCFKSLHDAGQLVYHGYDTSEQFVEYARAEYPGYAFARGRFENLPRFGFDCVYTRHTFEHAPPEEWEHWLACFLAASRRYAVIAWFLGPGYEHLNWVEAWNNTYDRERVMACIAEAGFEVEVTELNGSDHVYRLWRE